MEQGVNVTFLLMFDILFEKYSHACLELETAELEVVVEMCEQVCFKEVLRRSCGKFMDFYLFVKVIYIKCI